MEKEYLKTIYQELLGQIKNESDRSIAIIAAECINLILGEYISYELKLKGHSNTFINGSLSPGGFLGTSYQRSEFVYSNCWIDEHTYQDLKKIRELRNRFAHNLNMDSFDKLTTIDPKVANHIKQILSKEIHNPRKFLKEYNINQNLINSKRKEFIFKTLFVIHMLIYKLDCLHPDSDCTSDYSETQDSDFFGDLLDSYSDLLNSILNNS